MPVEENKAGDCMPTCPPTMQGIGISKSSLTKQRYVELVQLGKIASEELIKHGLLRHEYCEFGRIMEKIMQLE